MKKYKYWTIRVIAEWFSICTLIYVANLSVWFWFPCMLLIGTRLHALGIVGHMVAHKTAPQYLKYFTFVPLGIDMNKYKLFHFAHHRHLGTDKDPELLVVNKFKQKWINYRKSDLVFDAFGLNAYEAVFVLSKMASIRSLSIYSSLVALFVLIFGYVILLLPLSSITGLLLAHRLRARTEHEHLTNPGTTLQMQKPALWKRILYLPHGTWMHYEHHNNIRGT